MLDADADDVEVVWLSGITPLEEELVGVTVVLSVAWEEVETVTVLFCAHTVQGIVNVVAGQVGQGVVTVVVIGKLGEALLVVVVEGAEAAEVDGDVVVLAELLLGVVLGAVLPVEPGLTVELDAGVVDEQAALFTPLEGLLEGMPGILSGLPIHSLSQLIPGFAVSSSVKFIPKLSAILTP